MSVEGKRRKQFGLEIVSAICRNEQITTIFT